jgi:hypothetical protein
MEAVVRKLPGQVGWVQVAAALCQEGVLLALVVASVVVVAWGRGTAQCPPHR